VNFLATRKPRIDRVYFDDRLLSRKDWATLALRLLIPLSLIAVAFATGKGWIP
jgi:hypothetical protein